jgi:hypothetical protein
MSRFLSVAIAGACVLAAASCTQNDPAVVQAAVTRAAIRSEITAGVRATVSKNIDAYLAQIPDAAGVRDSAGAAMTRAMMRAQVLEGWAMIDTTRALDVLIDTIIPRGDSATVLTTTRWDRLIFHEDHKGVDTLLSVIRHREVWRKTPDGWRSFDVTTLGKTTTVNGKPVPGVP